MGDELSCLTELLCCCILLEDAEYTNNMNNLRNNHNTINNNMDNQEINRMERNEDITIVEGEPLLKDTLKTVKIKRN